MTGIDDPGTDARPEAITVPQPRGEWTRAAAEELAERFRLVLETSGDVVVQYSPRGIVEWAAPSLETVFGWKPRDVVGTPFRLEHPDDFGATLEAYRQAVETGAEQFQQRARALAADGRLVWAEARTRVLRSPAGAVTGVLTVIRDVTDQVEIEAARSASEARYRLLAEYSSDFLALTSSDGIIQWVSPTVTRVLGWDPDEVVGQVGADFFHPDDLDLIGDNRKQVESGQSVYGRGRIRCKDGTYRWLGQSVRPVEDSSGAIVARVSAWHDIDAEIAAETALATSEARYRLLAENSTDVVIHTGGSGLIEWVSPSLTTVLGWDPDEFVGQRVAAFMHPDDVVAMVDTMREMLERGELTGRTEARYRTKDGRWRWMSVGGRALLDEHGELVGGIDALRDVQAEHDVREELRRLATHDSMTDLPNRRDLLDRLSVFLSHEPRAGTVLGLLFIDLDGLKTINDTYGHGFGDVVLTEVAHRIRSAVRSDDIVARFGGDEFVVLLPALRTLEDAKAIAATVVSKVSSPVEYGGVSHLPTVSVGYTVAEAGDEPREVLHRADEALLQAKAEGRDRAVADPELT